MTDKIEPTLKFRPLSMMELRSRPGEILDEVGQGSRAYVIERNGQQKACLVPISHFLPDIPTDRIAEELERLSNKNEPYRVAFNNNKEIQLVFPNAAEGADSTPIDVTVTLPHGYPVKSPLISAEPIDEDCPQRWHDGTLRIFGVIESWNPSEHDIVHVLILSRQWLRNYAHWQGSGDWPIDFGVEIER